MKAPQFCPNCRAYIGPKKRIDLRQVVRIRGKQYRVAEVSLARTRSSPGADLRIAVRYVTVVKE